MGQNWTKRQREAIEKRNENLLVSAGAGSGKTAVMTERIIQLLLEGTDLRNMLVVTFTNAAASEMRRRIQVRLGEIVADGLQEDAVRMRARDQLEAFSQANISTIHSFCIQVLRRHFHEVDLDPAFRVGDEYETSILRKEAVEDVTENQFRMAEESFLLLDDAIGDRSDGLEKWILRVYAFMMSLPEPWTWLREACDAYDVTPEKLAKSPVYESYCQWGAEECQKAVDALSQARMILPMDAEGDRLRAQLDEECSLVRAAAMQLRQKNMRTLLPKTAIFKRFSFPREREDIDKESIKSQRDQAKKIWETLEKQDWSPEQNAKKMCAMFPAMQGLYAAIEQYHTVYQQKKQEKGMVDFADLEHFALQALQKEHVRQEYREKFAFLFVDEYQDSNGVQESILSCMTKADNLFCVGDSKQSIYRFRAADPSLFLARTQAYENDKSGTVIPLNQNFRSQENILHAVNDVFSIAMPMGGEQKYESDDMLYAGRESEETAAPVQVCLIEEGKKAWDEMEDDDAHEINRVQAEAYLIAQKIHSRIGETIYDPKTKQTRKIQYRDFAILLRSVRGSAEVMARTLAEEGIPSYADLSGGYFDALEIQVLMDLLRLIDNRDQDLAWLSVLRAGFCGFCDADLVVVCAEKNQKSMLEKMMDWAEAGNDETSQKCQAILCLLEEAKQRELAMHLAKLIEWLVDITHYEAMVAVLRGAEQRKANIESFLKLAQTYEGLSARGLSGFIRFLEGFQEAGEDMGEARLSGEGADCVRIVSIHKSKGLEYPIVFLAQCGKKRNMTDLRQKMILHRYAGIGMKYVDVSRHCMGDTLLWRETRRIVEQEAIAEELRVLYVAMTRAMNELILMGSVKHMDKSIPKWQAAQASATLLDFVMDALMNLDASDLWLKSSGLSRLGTAKHANAKWHLETIAASGIHLHDVDAIQNESLRMFLDSTKSVDTHHYEKWINWRYEYVPLPSKVAVSALSQGRMTLDTTPRFLMPKRMTATDRGVAAHTFLQHVNWKSVLDEADILRQAGQMVTNEVLSEEQADALRISLLKKFFESDLGRRMCKAADLETEKPFAMKMPVEALYEDACDGQITIQGVIDACFLENDEWILVDYKTDYVDAQQGMEKVAELYALQLNLYAYALQKLTGKNVREKWVVLLSCGDAVLISNQMKSIRPNFQQSILHAMPNTMEETKR